MDPLDTKASIEGATGFFGQTERLRRVVAILTSIVALFAAIGGLMSIRCNTRAMVAKDEAILAQELATDKWSYFQSRNVRQEIAELFLESGVSRTKKNDLQNKVGRFKQQADDLYKDAKAIEARRDAWNASSHQYLEASKFFASALAFLQVALIFLPLTLLVNSLLLFIMGNILGFSGAVLLVAGYIQYFQCLASKVI